MTEQNNHDLSAKTTNTGEPAHARENRHERPRSFDEESHERSSRPHFKGSRPSGPRRGGGRYQSDRRPRSQQEIDPRITELIRDAEEKLSSSHAPVQFENLNPFERKQIHQHFERRKALFQTKTYRKDDDDYVLWIFPVANLKKFAEDKAKEALERGEEVILPPMSNYERFIIHNALKELGSVETVSAGEGDERHIEIHPKKFGRSLKKIVKKIKLF